MPAGTSREGGGSGWRELLAGALQELTGLLHEEGVVSAYELHSSGLVQALLALLATSHWDDGEPSGRKAKMHKQRVHIFNKCFKVMIYLFLYIC